MKQLKLHLVHFLIFVFIGLNTNAQQIFKSLDTKGNSTYLPQIAISADSLSFGPYFINSIRTNNYSITELPDNTSKVIMKYIDSNGEQLGDSKISEGTDIQTVDWTVNAEDIGFVLSSSLSIEVYYDSDSIATYKFPYLVYPDTVKFQSTAGWGPFITNNYNMNPDWQPVPAQLNTFTISNLPPRTDSLIFQILTHDSIVLKSQLVFQGEGIYFSEAVFEDVRMDSLLLSTNILRTLIWCDGAPKKGLEFHKKLNIIPQEPKLISKTEENTIQDSIRPFVENQFIGQALGISKTSYAEITNAPGLYYKYEGFPVRYRGPYSIDLFTDSYSMESWIKISPQDIQNASFDDMIIMSVKDVWAITLTAKYNKLKLILKCPFAPFLEDDLFYAELSQDDFIQKEWHHIAFTSSYTGSGYPDMKFYLDGDEFTNTTFNHNIYDILNQSYIKKYFKTEPLCLGPNPYILYISDYNMVTALDEVRIWNTAITSDYIKNNFHKKILQSESLIGYWNFDDLRNHLGVISDLSYKNNMGKLKKGATFIPQYPYVQTTPDSLMIYSSNLDTDSLTYSFIDINGKIIDSCSSDAINSGDTLVYNLASLPEDIKEMQINEFNKNSGYLNSSTVYNLHCFSPPPIATPRYNWNTYYYSSGNMGKFYNSILVSGLSEKTQKIELGLQKGDDYFNVESFTANSNPFAHSLTLNGTDNYVSTTQTINSPSEFSISLWFKTTTKEGGKIIGFYASNALNFRTTHDRELILEPDGALRFYLNANGSTLILTAANKYNDGNWHHAAVSVSSDRYAKLFVDGSVVDIRYFQYLDSPYQGKWIIGRNSSKGMLNTKNTSIAEYFQGSICELKISESENSLDEINASMYDTPDFKNLKYYYKFNEGHGSTITDYTGNNNGSLHGSSQRWYKTNMLTKVVWNHNIIDKQPGNYDFFARIFYEGQDSGYIYNLGRIDIKEPFPGYGFTYSMVNGFGYFNEGTLLTNPLTIWINKTNSDTANWKDNFVKYNFLSPKHEIINQDIFTYTNENVVHTFWIDMGDALPGSYLNLQTGFHTTDDHSHITDQLSYQLYFNTMLPPVISGDFGPFDQAIAPGTMQHNNIFTITTEIISDLNKVVGEFYDTRNRKLGEADAIQENDTIWHLSYDMAKLSPPISNLKIKYYLGTNQTPALIQGPFPINIHKTRPVWFDFLKDDAFHSIEQNGNKVSFSVNTPLTHGGTGKFHLNEAEKIIVPNNIQLIGNAVSEIHPAICEAKLIYNIPDYSLTLDQDAPTFYQNSTVLGASSGDVNFDFNISQDDSYSMDSDNNIIATQNFSTGGSISAQILQIEGEIGKIKDLISVAEVLVPESVIIKPDFSISVKGSFQYSSRLHLKTDEQTAGWGSFGNLDINADPNSGEVYENSASYNFYTGILDIEFDIGATLLEGLAAGHFGLDGRIDLGYGHSYTTIPYNRRKELKSAVFQVYGKFYIDLLWDWYEKTIWGPKLFYSNNFWGDDMSTCFPAYSKQSRKPEGISSNSSWPELSDNVNHVISKFAKMQMPHPEPSITNKVDNILFTWLERGDTFGERKLVSRILNNDSFAKETIINVNNNALNTPISEVIDNELGFYCWAQNRYTNLTILDVKSDNILEDFFKAQDIWFAVYDFANDSLIIKEIINDDTKSLTSGRTEANPKICILSNEKVMIVWLVVDLDNLTSEFWQVSIDKSNNNWTTSEPKIMTKIDGIATQLHLTSVNDETAVATWLRTDKTEDTQNKIISTVFNGQTWSAPTVLLDDANHYYNYIDLNITGEKGGLFSTVYIEDSLLQYEKIVFVPWDNTNNNWNAALQTELLTDSINHLQLPCVAINDNGDVTLAIKVERLVPKGDNDKISQVDLLRGNINYPQETWSHFIANKYVCDTTKQVNDIQLTYSANDSLIILLNEYPMAPTNMRFIPANGIIFGDPYMNLVLRSFAFDDYGEIIDVDENDFFTDIQTQPENNVGIKLYQNFPNPCSNQTTIPFDIPERLSVKLELFDATGNKIATLLEHQLVAGRYEQTLNTNLLKPGIYVYRLTAGKKVASLRMMVTK